MSFIFDSLSGDNGAGYKAQGTNPDQLNSAYGQTQQGIQQQQSFLNSLASQNGIQNQSNVFAQQQGLANQLQGVADGTGPNPALAQLENTTGQNVAQQAALMAGQRGASANTGLLARQIGQQGANIQQQAVGQGAALQAQQQFAGLSALQQQQQMLQGLATQQVGQQQNALTGYNQAAQGQQQNLYALQANQNSANAGVAQQNAKTQGQATGGLLNGLASAPMAFADGGAVAYAPPPAIAPSPDAPDSATGPKSSFAKIMQGFGKGFEDSSIDSGQKNWNQFGKNVGSLAGKGVSGIGSLFEPSMEVLPAAEALGPALLAARGGAISGESIGQAGKKVPGKAKVAGNSLKNDVIDAKLSPGEIVIPRSHANDPDKAAAFARQVVLNTRKKAA